MAASGLDYTRECTDPRGEIPDQGATTLAEKNKKELRTKLVAKLKAASAVAKKIGQDANNASSLFDQVEQAK